MKCFGLSFLKCNRSVLVANILFAQQEQKECGSSSIAPLECTQSQSGSTVPCHPIKNVKTSLRLCPWYLDGNCSNVLCKCLHICKEFLINGNKCLGYSCMFGFSHDPLDEHNKDIMQERGINEFQRSEIMVIIINSFPRLCKYQEHANCVHVNCNKIHICKKYASGICDDNTCALSHDFKDEHNMKVLKSYSLDNIQGNKWKKILTTNILFSKSIITGVKSESLGKPTQMAALNPLLNGRVKKTVSFFKENTGTITGTTIPPFVLEPLRKDESSAMLSKTTMRSVAFERLRREHMTRVEQLGFLCLSDFDTIL